MSVIWEPRLSDAATTHRELARELTTKYFEPIATDIDRDQRYPYESVDRLTESGLTSLIVPEAHGGLGASLESTCAVVEAIAVGCASTAAILCIYVLGGMVLLFEGSEEQKARYLPGLSQGKAISFALTESTAGSDAGAIQTTATPESGGYRLRGEKIFIGNGGASQHYVVFAKTPTPERARGITAFLVDKDSDGVVIDRYEDKMGLRGTLTSNLKLDTFVSDADVVGRLGFGFQLALRALDLGRITVAAQALGTGIAAFRASAERAVTRQTFGQPIITHQGIGFELADVATELSSARMLMYEAASAYDRNGDPGPLAAMTKLAATRASHHAVDIGVQIFGGMGYCKPTLVERLYRDQRINEIYEGSSEIQRLVLARAIRSWATAAH
jgi:alkylation response protein AidB-like acyl-CoA dehydrogenase